MKKTIASLLLACLCLTACDPARADVSSSTIKKEISSTVKIGFIFPEGKHHVEIIGSGVIVGEHLVLTARHVVLHGKPQKEFLKLSDGTVFTKFYVCKISLFHDLALIEVPDAHFKHPAKLAKRMPKVGERVYATGYPLGLFLSFTEGIVNFVEGGLIVHQAPIIFGNSGGPLWDTHGRVVGINVSMFTPVPSWAGNGVAEGVDHIRYFLNSTDFFGLGTEKE